MRTVYATVLEVRDEADIEATLDFVGRWISDWYRRQRLSVNDVIGILASGDTEAHPKEGHTISIKRHETSTDYEQSLVDLVWSYPDQYDKSLGWSTTLSFLRTPNSLLLSLDVSVTGLTFQVAPANIKLGSPRVVRDVTRLNSVFLGGRPYNVAPELIPADIVDVLTAELCDAVRSYPIIIVSRRTADDKPLIDAISLAENLAGVAKVYELTDKWAAFRLTEEVGKALSCYEGAIRIYWPRFTVHSSSFAHPIWMPWQLQDEGTAENSIRQITRTVFDAASFRHVQPHEIAAHRRAAERAARQLVRNAAAESADTDKLLEDLYRLEEELKSVEATNEELAKECETLRANAMALASSTSWNEVFQAPSSTSLQSTETAPLQYASVLDAVRSAEKIAEHLIFLPNAYEAAADSPFRQPDRVVQAIEAIDDIASIWVESLEGEAVGSIRQLFKERGFTYADDVSQTSKGKWGGEYKVTYNGSEYDISPHITIGAKQADTCLSIHWAWAKEQKKVLIAHVGRHKTNTKS